MIKGILFAIVFAVLGWVAFALIMPLVLPHANPEKLGEFAAPFIVIICSGYGFVNGWERRRKSTNSTSGNSNEKKGSKSTQVRELDTSRCARTSRRENYRLQIRDTRP